MKKAERMLGKFQCKKGDFGFFIPDNRADWGGDFFVHQKNFFGAVDGQRVAAEILDRDSGKKPEVKIIELFGTKKEEEAKKYAPKIVEGVYSAGLEFGFVDIPGKEKGYFCHKSKSQGAGDGDHVRAEIKKYNGKEEAIIIEVLHSTDLGRLTGIYTDGDGFGFVKPDDGSEDIFIAGSRKAEAQTDNKVEVRIIKVGGRRREGVVEQIL